MDTAQAPQALSPSTKTLLQRYKKYTAQTNFCDYISDIFLVIIANLVCLNGLKELCKKNRMVMMTKLDN